MLISSCPKNEVKVGKLLIIPSCTCNFVSKLLQGGKNMVAFCSTLQKRSLIVSTVCRSQNRICNANQGKENDILNS